jgi:phospholipid-transporting ATPase
VYFFVIMCMQMIPIISISNGKPAMLLPLLFVIGVSMIKDIFEDSKRHKSDKLENFKSTEVYDPISKDFIEVHWQDLRVGQIVKVSCDKFLPADMILVQSSDAKGVCYIETKNLDGETNLKHKTAVKALHSGLAKVTEYEQVIKGTVVCERPND